MERSHATELASHGDPLTEIARLAGGHAAPETATETGSESEIATATAGVEVRLKATATSQAARALPAAGRGAGIVREIATVIATAIDPTTAVAIALETATRNRRGGAEVATVVEAGRAVPRVPVPDPAAHRGGPVLLAAPRHPDTPRLPGATTGATTAETFAIVIVTETAIGTATGTGIANERGTATGTATVVTATEIATVIESETTGTGTENAIERGTVREAKIGRAHV